MSAENAINYCFGASAYLGFNSSFQNDCEEYAIITCKYSLYVLCRGELPLIKRGTHYISQSNLKETNPSSGILSRARAT